MAAARSGGDLLFPLVFRRRAASEISRWSAAFPVVALRSEEEGAEEKCERVVSSGLRASIYRHRWRRGVRISRTRDFCNRCVGRGNGVCSADRGGAQPFGVPRLILETPNRQSAKIDCNRVTGKSDGSWDPQDVATVPRVLRGSEKEAFGGTFVRIQGRAAIYLGAVMLTSDL